MLAYKVTTSGRSVYAPTAGIVRYVIGETTRRPKGCGPLTAFDTLNNAKAFLRAYALHPSTIFMCRIRKSRATKLWVYSASRKRWLPKGTIFADTVTPIQQVR